jgi:hypothetical protein
MHHPSPPEFDRGIGSLLHLESHPARGPPKTSTAQERPSTSDDDNMGTSVWVSTTNLEPIMIRPCPASGCLTNLLPHISPCLRRPSAHPLHALFRGYKALCRLPIDISTLFARYRYLQYFYTPPDCSEVPRVFPRALPSLNHPPRLCAAARHTSSILAS